MRRDSPNLPGPPPDMRCHTLYESEGRVWRLFYPDPLDAQTAGVNLLALSAGGRTVLVDPGGAAAFPELLAALTAEIDLDTVSALVITRAGLETSSALPLWRRVCPEPPRVYAPAAAFEALAQMDAGLAPVALPDEGPFTPVKGAAPVRVIPAPGLPSADAVTLYDAEAGLLCGGEISAGPPSKNSNAGLDGPGADEPADADGPFARHFSRRARIIAGGHALRMSSAAARGAWLLRVHALNVRIIAPRRGLLFKDAAVRRFFDWFGELETAEPLREPPGAAPEAQAGAVGVLDPAARGVRRDILAAAGELDPDAGAAGEAVLDEALDAALVALEPARARAPAATAGAPTETDIKTAQDAALLEAALGGAAAPGGGLETLDDAVDKAIEDAAVLDASVDGEGAAKLSDDALDQALDDLIDETIYMPVLDDAVLGGGRGTGAAARIGATPGEPEAPRYRLVTRSDFDGVVCAVLLEELDLIGEIKFVHPKDMQDGAVAVSGRDITANMPYTPGAHLAFDHHASEENRLGGGADNYINDPDAPSAAHVIYEYFGGRTAFPRISAEMMRAVDKADSGRFTLDEVLDPQGWDMLHFVIDSRTGLGRFQEFRVPHYEMMMGLVDVCRDRSIYEILAAPDVKERVELYMRHRGQFEEQVRRCTKMRNGLAVLDLRGEEIIYVGNRFLIYALFPECRLSMHIMWGRDHKNVVFACGKSIFNRSSQIDIGALMLEHGGGGHAAAGGCQIALEGAERIAAELIEQLTQEE
ncbi:MAG: oxygen-binding di-iron domain-containing protein [Rhodospirillales bacterium]